MKKVTKQLLLLPAFKKFITASTTGRRLQPSGKRIKPGTIEQYHHTYILLTEYCRIYEPLRIQMLFRPSQRIIQQEKNYWWKFYMRFSSFLYQYKKYYDKYTGSVFKIIKVFFNYLYIEKALPVGDFHKRFRIPAEHFIPAIITPAQLRFLITDRSFESSLSPTQQKVKDIFVFGCTVGLRYQDLMGLKKTNIQYTPEGVNAVLHTQKTGAEVRIPLPDYAVQIIKKYSRKSGRYVLPRLADSNLNLQIKALIKKAGWDYSLPKIRHRRGEPVEVKTKRNETYRFYDHISAHTMRRTAITTLLLMGVDEISVRRISGHAAGSKEFYRYVVLVQDYLNVKLRDAYTKLLTGDNFNTSTQ